MTLLRRLEVLPGGGTTVWQDAFITISSYIAAGADSNHFQILLGETFPLHLFLFQRLLRAAIKSDLKLTRSGRQLQFLFAFSFEMKLFA